MMPVHVEQGTQAEALTVDLVAMPWARKATPSGALGALSAYLHRERPRDTIRTKHAYLSAASAIGFDLYDAISSAAYKEGELFYAALLYPERTARVREHFRSWALEKLARAGTSNADDLFDATLARLREHAHAVAAGCSSASVVGLTTAFGQLFANIVVARAIKRLSPNTVVVIGGSTVSSRVGASLLDEYSCIDYVVQGEGELPFTQLLEQIGRKRPPPARSVIGATETGVAAAGGREARSLDDLPYATYDDYVESANALGITWALTVEGSRGCWWDRTKRHDDPKATCYFCNLNVQWGGYREKSPRRLADEVAHLAERYRNVRVDFLDNIMRVKGVDELADALESHHKQFHIFHELRAGVRSFDLLRLWEAGLSAAQFGVEALSTRVLRRIGKGTTAIQNLHAMRLCAELGIEHRGNIISDFPGSTADEVKETCRNIRDYAWAYQPLFVSPFHLGVGSTVDALRTEFGVTNVRNCDVLKAGLPSDVWSRLELFDLSFDLEGASDWSSVRRTCEEWTEAHATTSDRMLVYHDGGSFITIGDRRDGTFREGVFGRLPRDVYLFCMDVRSYAQVLRRFPTESESTIRAALDDFVGYGLVFSEGDKFLSLALAPSARHAARRIHAAQESERTFRPSPVRLPVLSPDSAHGADR